MRRPAHLRRLKQLLERHARLNLDRTCYTQYASVREDVFAPSAACCTRLGRDPKTRLEQGFQLTLSLEVDDEVDLGFHVLLLFL